MCNETKENGDGKIVQIDNYINGEYVPPKDTTNATYIDVTNPINNKTIAKVAVSSSDDVNDAVQAASDAYKDWSTNYTIKARAAILLKFHALIRDNAEELAKLIVQENGKNLTEALADVAKGNETVEYACSLSLTAPGNILQVSSGNVICQDKRTPLGVIVSIVPFNFPLMVPMWTIPIALMMGNTVVLKPSEKVPMTMHRVAQLFEQAGLPKGCFNMIQGTKDTVQALIQHSNVKAVTFVGSSPVAAAISLQCRTIHKRCTALGGAKNHLIALPDCHIPTTASDIVVSFAGCAGQRCMAASVLLLIGEQPELLQAVIDYASKIQPGNNPGEMGPVIDPTSYDKINKYITQAETDGAKILLDGRSWKKDEGNWIGPTIIHHTSSTDTTMCEEVFGPVLSVYVCTSWEEAIQIENNNPFGNAAAIYTTSGGNAEWFLSQFRASMLGCNIGIPVPREPFSFGGLYGTRSKYGDMDITGDGAVEFFSNRIKITTKWPPINVTETTTAATNNNNNNNTDRANFAGSM